MAGKLKPCLVNITLRSDLQDIKESATKANGKNGYIEVNINSGLTWMELFVNHNIPLSGDLMIKNDAGDVTAQLTDTIKSYIDQYKKGTTRYSAKIMKKSMSRCPLTTGKRSSTSTTTNTEAPSPKQARTEDVTPVKRGRGRPPGSSSKTTPGRTNSKASPPRTSSKTSPVRISTKTSAPRTYSKTCAGITNSPTKTPPTETSPTKTSPTKTSVGRINSPNKTSPEVNTSTKNPPTASNNASKGNDMEPDDGVEQAMNGNVANELPQSDIAAIASSSNTSLNLRINGDQEPEEDLDSLFSPTAADGRPSSSNNLEFSQPEPSTDVKAAVVESVVKCVTDKMLWRVKKEYDDLQENGMWMKLCSSYIPQLGNLVNHLFQDKHFRSQA